MLLSYGLRTGALHLLARQLPLQLLSYLLIAPLYILIDFDRVIVLEKLLLLIVIVLGGSGVGGVLGCG